jgi:hypothetical protein
MVTVNDNLITNFLVGIDQLTPRLNTMIKGVGGFESQLSKAMNLTRMNRQLSEVGLTMNNAGKIIDPTTNKFVKYSDAIRSLVDNDQKKFIEQQGIMAKKSKEMKNRFDMNTLSWLFAGMAMQRMGMTMMRFMIPSMDKLQKLNTTAAKKVMGVGAAFEFLKISLFETLMAIPWVQDFVAGLINFMVNLAEFTQKHPEWVAAMAVVSGAFIALGTAAMGVGLAKQIGHMFKLAYNALTGWVGTDGKEGKFGSLLNKFKNHWKTGLGVISIAAGVALAINMLTTESDAKSRLAGTLGIAMAGAIAGLMFGGPVGAVIGGSIGFGVGVVVSIIDYIIEDKPTWADFQNTVKEMFSGWGRIGWTATGPSLPLLILFKTMATTDKRQMFEESTQRVQDEIARVRELAKPLGGDAQLGYLLMGEGNYDLQAKYIQDLISKEDALRENTKLTNVERIKQGVALEEQRSALQELIPNFFTMESQIRNGIQATSDMGDKTKEVTDMQISQYTNLFAEQLASKEETAKLIKNTENFGKAVERVFGGTEDTTGVIGQFQNFGKEIIADNDYFTALKEDIEAWASQETVKTVKIKYVHEGSGGDGEEGFFERVGRSADSLVGSITGG